MICGWFCLHRLASLYEYWFMFSFFSIFFRFTCFAAISITMFNQMFRYNAKHNIIAIINLVREREHYYRKRIWPRERTKWNWPIKKYFNDVQGKIVWHMDTKKRWKQNGKYYPKEWESWYLAMYLATKSNYIDLKCWIYVILSVQHYHIWWRYIAKKSTSTPCTGSNEWLTLN